MIDFEKLRKDFTKRLHTFSADDLQKWLDMDKLRLAQAEQEDALYQPASRMAIGKLNGVTQSTAKSKGVAIKKKKTTTPSKTRSRNSAKSMATAV